MKLLNLASRIEDCGRLGDCWLTAVVDRSGSMDGQYLPRFDLCECILTVGFCSLRFVTSRFSVVTIVATHLSGLLTYVIGIVKPRSSRVGRLLFTQISITPKVTGGTPVALYPTG